MLRRTQTGMTKKFCIDLLN